MIKSVKKFSKKSLAILIALLMIISVMPFTPPISVEAADKTAAEYQALIDPIFTEIGTTGYTANNPEAADKSYSSNTTFAGGDEMSNVLYTYGVGGNAAYISNSKTDVKAGAQYGPVVFLYDGGKMAVPVNFFGIKTARAVARFLEAAWPTTSGFTLKHNWHGSNSSSTGYQTGTSKSFRYQDPKSEIYDRNSNVDTKKNYYYSNTLYYEGTLSDTTEYVSEYVSWGWRLSGSALGSEAFKFNETSSFTMNDSASNTDKSGNPTINIVNYMPIKKILPKVKKEYEAVKANVTSNSNYYTQESLANYYQLVYNVVSLNPNSYDYASDPAGKAEEAGKAISEAAKAYTTRVLVRRQYGVTFVTNNETSTTTYYEVNTPASSVTKPANTAATKIDENSHYTYSWPIVSDVTADATYYEEKNKVAHSYTNKYTSGDTAKVECSCGHYYTLNASAYKAAVLDAKASIANSKAYSQASRDALSNVLSEQAIAIKTAITQEAVDNCTSTIVSANQLKTVNDSGLKVGTLEYNQYSITVKYVDENGNDLAVGEKGATSKTYPAVNYGSIQNIVAPTSYNDVDYAVYKWTREDKSNSSISGLNSSSLDVVVKGASTYYVFLKKTSVDSSQVEGNSFAITLNNKSNKVVDIGYAAKTENATVTISGNDITVGGVKLTAPNYSFYKVKGFTINGNPVADGDTIAINSNMVIKPEYKAKQSVKITRASANILINDKDDDSVDVEWNKKIVMTYKGAVPDGKVVIWKDGNGNVLAQGSTYSFYANSNVTISATVEASAPKDPTASIGMFSYDATDNKVTVVNNFYVPEGMKAVKAGVVLSTKTDNIDTLKEQKTGRFEGTADKFSGTDTNKNQIRISVTRTATTSFTMHALAYVVVEDKNGNTETYYAPTVRSITYPANTTA